MDWKQVGNAVISVGAPLLGGALFGPAGAAVGSIIAGKFGVSPDATPDQVLTAINGDPDATLKLREIETTHVERLQALENERLRIETADVQSARSVHKDSWVPWVLTFTLVAMVSGIVAALLWVAIPEDNKEVVYLVVGQLIGAFSTAIAYWLGSSKSSASKDAHIAGIIKR